MSLLKANTIKPVTAGTDLSLQGDSGGSAVDCLNITSAGDVNFTGNTDAKIKLPSAGGIYKGASDTAILTESGGAVTLDNVSLGSGVVLPAGNNNVAAWVVFDGTSDTGNNAAQTILDSLNVTSVTRSGTGTGVFVFNLSITMANSNYVIIGSANAAGSGASIAQYDSTYGAISTTSFGVRVRDVGDSYVNVAYTTLIVIGDR